MEDHFPLAHLAGKHLHLGVCGSIAAYKALDLLRAFRKAEIKVTVSLTEAARRFITPLSFQALGAEQVSSDMFAPACSATATFEHLTPGAEADAFLIAPASATTLARLACGLADNLLAAQSLAWKGPLLLAPAMNPRMWQNVATRDNCATLTRRGHIIISPDCGQVACGEEGEGRLADTRAIFLYSLRAMSKADLSGKKVMLTLGPTREPWDAVRFWSNHSTGRMGASLALAAWLRGAEVHALCGPVYPWLPPQIHIYNTPTAGEMFAQAEKLWPDMDIGVFAAAVADFSPVPLGQGKYKKDAAENALQVSFCSTPDILLTLGRRKKAGQRVIGFAAETDNLEENARRKLAAKNADFIVANCIGAANSGFASPYNTALFLDRAGGREQLASMPKAELAWRIFDWLSRL